MKRRSLAILIAVAILLTGAAIWAAVQRDRDSGPSFQAGPLFPGLSERIGAIAQIRVMTRDTALRVEHTEQGQWVVASKDNYPAKAAAVRRTIFALIGAKITDRATALPENHRKLGLVDPEKGGTATRVVLLDGAGGQLAAILIGNPMASDEIGSAPEPQSFFVRKPGDDQVWLVRGDLPIQSSAQAWIDPEIATIARARIQSATVTFPDGASYAVSRKTSDQPDFVLHAVPEGRAPAPSTDIANALGAAASSLSFDDVRPVAKLGLPVQTEHVVYRTFDGLVLDVALATVEDGIWATFTPALDETILTPPPPPAPPPVSPETPAASETPASGPATAPSPTPAPVPAPAAQPVAPEPPLETPDQVRAEAQAIKTRTAGWAYRLPDPLAHAMTHRVEDLLLPVAKAPPAKPAAAKAAKPKAGKAGKAKPKSQPAAPKKTHRPKTAQ